MKTLKHWILTGQDGPQIDLEVDGRHQMSLFVLESGLVRVLVRKGKKLRLDRTWTITPDPDQDVPWVGRKRLDVSGFECPGYDLEVDDEGLTIRTRRLRVRVCRPLALEWAWKDADGEWQPLMSDRRTGAYSLGVRDHACQHFVLRDGSEQYYGLGERSGNLNRHGRRFEMRNLDAMGYNAETTDPLYKHIPFYITRRQSVSYGLFYDNLATCWFDLGNELDNYHAWYSQYRAEDGDLDYYMMLGPDTLSVTKRFTRLTGRAIFGPKWSLGYSGSTMHYTDAPNAQEQLLGFVSLCQTHGVPCDSFQLSSGYTSIGDKRYVFNWNHDKVPSPEAMTQSFHEAGFHLAANIKPCLLRDHPQYTELEARGLFVQDSESNDPEVSMFWDAEGSHLDFTNPDTVQWWKDSVTTQLLQKGIDSTWNDNNEYEVWDQDARCRGFGKAVPIGLIRPLMPLLMMRASCEAQQAFAPDLRPFLISRSGCPGMQRYVQTWTGDNSTNWNSIRYNIRMGLGMALSGVTNIGHDVGGFAGPRPDPEMFVRWVQNGVMHPRFTIHSWNDDQTVNEPWMFPEVTPIIRRTIELRYQLLPYIYHQLFLAATEDEPILRPTFLDHEHDARCLEETDDYLFGRDLLVASIVEPGQRERDVYLPDNRHGWYDFYSGQWYAGAQTVRVPAPLERIPLFVRAGAILPLSKRLAYTDANQDNCRILRVYPLLGSGETTTSIFDDDGLTWGYRDGQYYRLSVQVAANAGQINLTLASDGNWIPGYADIKIVLPQQEKRKLVINGQGCENHCKVARP